PVARDQDRDWVAAKGGADGADGPVAADAVGQPGVWADLAAGDRQYRQEDFAFERAESGEVEAEFGRSLLVQCRQQAGRWAGGGAQLAGALAAEQLGE